MSENIFFGDTTYPHIPDAEDHPVLVIDAAGNPVLETCGSVKAPANYSFECVNNFVHCEDPQYEELQYLSLGMATRIAQLETELAEARKDIEILAADRDMHVKEKSAWISLASQAQQVEELKNEVRDLEQTIIAEREHMQELREEIKQLQAQQTESQWINVDEGSPEKYTEVLVWPYPTEYQITAERYADDWRYSEYTNGYGINKCICKVTHWQPLPLPPAPDGESK